MREQGQIEFAITAVEGRPPPRMKSLLLAEVPLVLLVPKDSPVGTAEELWTLKRISEPLISLPADETISRLFQKGLKARKVVWTPSIVASSLDSLVAYVSSGYGLGVGLAPSAQQARRMGLRVLPLDGFNRLQVMALWQGTPAPALGFLIDQTRHYAENHRRTAGS
ncbi:MAG: LysR family transcriptional regulator substrate-binding protein [Opitutaceae bacterium]